LNNGEVIDREAKRGLFDGFALIGKAVSSGRRVELLDILANGARSVEGLAEQVGLSVANTSQHLQTLRRAGLVESRRSGTSVIYRLASTEVFTFLTALRTVAGGRLAEIGRLADAYLGDQDPEPPLTRTELAARLRRKEDVVIVDVRPREEYLAGHLPGAVSMPLDQLAKGLRRLPKDKEIVAYCRGPYCAYSHAAVALLRKRGFRARRLEDGLPEWAAENLPIQAGEGSVHLFK